MMNSKLNTYEHQVCYDKDNPVNPCTTICSHFIVSCISSYRRLHCQQSRPIKGSNQSTESKDWYTDYTIVLSDIFDLSDKICNMTTLSI